MKYQTWQNKNKCRDWLKTLKKILLQHQLASLKEFSPFNGRNFPEQKKHPSSQDIV